MSPKYIPRGVEGHLISFEPWNLKTRMQHLGLLVQDKVFGRVAFLDVGPPDVPVTMDYCQIALTQP